MISQIHTNDKRNHAFLHKKKDILNQRDFSEIIKQIRNEDMMPTHFGRNPYASLKDYSAKIEILTEEECYEADK